MTDYTRYHVDESAFTSGIALMCLDCDNPDGLGDQVTPISVANLIALADEHEAENHAEKPKAKRAARPKRQYRFSGDVMTAPHDEPKF